MCSLHISFFYKQLHMICWLARGFYLTNSCDYSHLKFFAMSTIPEDLFANKGKKFSVRCSAVLQWYRKTFKVNPDYQPLSKSLVELFVNKRTTSYTSYMQGLLCVFRILGFRARVLLHFSPKATSRERYANKKVEGKPSKKVMDRSETSQFDQYLSMKIVPFECTSHSANEMWIEVFDECAKQWIRMYTCLILLHLSNILFL